MAIGQYLGNLRQGNYGAANALMARGADTFTNAVDTYGARVKARAENQALSNLMGMEQGNMNTMDYRNALMKSTQSNPELNAKQGLEAIGLMTNPLLSYDKGKYGFQTDPLGNAYSYDKNTGNYSQVASSPWGPGNINPANIVLKPVVNTDSMGVKTTTQVPFDKTTGQPVQQGGGYRGIDATGGTTGNAGFPVDNTSFPTDTPAKTPVATGGSNPVFNYIGETYGITTKEQFTALPELTQRKIIADAQNATAKSEPAPVATATPVVNNSGVSVQQPPLLDKTIQLRDGRTVYVNNAGEPVLGRDGQPIVKSTNAAYGEQQEQFKASGTMLRELDKMETAVKNTPGAIGSIGENPKNWLLNQVQDIIEVPTETYVNRDAVTGASGVMSSTLRKANESGVMTDSDFERYQKITPNADDSIPVFMAKMKKLRTQMSAQYGPVPAGYVRQRDSATGEYRFAPEGGK